MTGMKDMLNTGLANHSRLLDAPVVYCLFQSEQHAGLQFLRASRLSGSTKLEAAIKAAFKISSNGIASNISLPTSIVRHSESPQTEQQRLAATFASSHSSMGFPAIQIRFDWDGSDLNDSLSISLISKVVLISRGRRTSSSFAMACCRPLYVSPHRTHVWPSGSTSRCQMIGRYFIAPSTS